MSVTNPLTGRKIQIGGSTFKRVFRGGSSAPRLIIPDYVAVAINRCHAKGIILSNNDIRDFMEEGDDGQVNENQVLAIIRQLLETGQIYEHGNRDSYIQRVRANHFISLSEYVFLTNIIHNPGHRVNFDDAEYPLDNNGMYIIEGTMPPPIDRYRQLIREDWHIIA